jgi:hypothetical protein
MHVTNVMGQHFSTAWTYIGLSGIFPVNHLLLCKVQHDSYACLVTVTQPVEVPPHCHKMPRLVGGPKLRDKDEYHVP